MDFASGHKRGIAVAVGGLLCAALVLPQVFGSATLQQEATTLWVDDDCVDYIGQAKSSMGMSSSGTKGENEIPEPYGDVYSVTGYCRRGIQYFDGARQPTTQAEWDSTSPQHVVHKRWVSDGCKYDDGIAAIDGKLLVAVTKKFGNVGDWVTFYLSNGKKVECIIADVKGKDANSEWGHDGGRCVLEFEVEPAAYTAHGNPGNGYHTELNGARTTSWTNHGAAINVADEMGGSVSGASSASGAANRGTAASALAECEVKPKYDNSTLVSAYISVSYSRSRMQPGSDPSTALYQEVCEAVLDPKDVTAKYHYHSCDRGVASVIRWTGADINFPAYCCTQGGIDYCNGSPLWEAVSGAQNVTIDGGDEWAEAHGIEPGDIGITPEDHVLVYVGHEAVEEGYEKFIKGNDGTQPGTGGDIGEPTSTSSFVSASAPNKSGMGRGDNISDVTDPRHYYFFRYVGDYPDADKYADVGEKATLSRSNSRGTSCDCNECPPEGARTPSTAAEVMAQVAEHIADDDSHGYSQPNRAGDGTTETIQVNGSNIEIHGGDYDCSSMMSECAIAAGLITRDQVFWTGSEDAVLTSAGFTKMDFSASEAQRGDILWHSGHTGMCIGDGMQADAHGAEGGGIHGTQGDQTGYEISRTELWSNYWTYIYRPPGGSAKSSGSSSRAEECGCGGEWDDYDTPEGDENAMMEANAKKLWSVFSAWGLSDEAIAGMLSNFETECGIDPTGIEAIYDSPYAMNGRKAPMRGTDQESLDNLADWTEGGMRSAYAGSGITLAWDFYNGSPDGRHYAGIGIGSWTGSAQVHDVYSKAASINSDWWSMEFQIAYLLAADSNANPPGEEFWKQYSEKTKGKDATTCADIFYGTYEMPGWCGPASFRSLHMQHATKWYNKIKTWSPDSSYANSVLSMASRLADTASLDGLSAASKNCPTVSNKVTELGATSSATSSSAEDLVTKAMSMVGAGYQTAGYTDGGSPSNSSFESAGLVDWALGKASDTSSSETLYKSILDAGNLKTDPSEFVRGDLVFYDHGGKHPGHVAIYIGDGQVVHANGSQYGVVVQDVYFNGTPIGGGKYV